MKTKQDIKSVGDDELEREVTELRNCERALRKARKYDEAKTLLPRITEIALEQGRRWRIAQDGHDTFLD